MPVSATCTVKNWWSASRITFTFPCSRLYLMAFSIRLVKINESFTSSTSAIISRLLMSVSSISVFLAIGRSRRKISSVSALISTDVIFTDAADLSIFTSASRSLMILSSRSISSAISTMNSRYSSTGTSSCAIRESASTFMEVIGVFSSWETFATKSCLVSSSAFILCSTLLNASTICSVSM